MDNVVLSGIAIIMSSILTHFECDYLAVKGLSLLKFKYIIIFLSYLMVFPGRDNDVEYSDVTRFPGRWMPWHPNQDVE